MSTRPVRCAAETAYSAFSFTFSGERYSDPAPTPMAAAPPRKRPRVLLFEIMNLVDLVPNEAICVRGRGLGRLRRQLVQIHGRAPDKKFVSGDFCMIFQRAWNRVERTSNKVAAEERHSFELQLWTFLSTVGRAAPASTLSIFSLLRKLLSEVS